MMSGWLIVRRACTTLQLNVSYPATGCQKLFEVLDEHKLRIFYEKRMGAEVEPDQLGDEWKGYILRVAGGNDKHRFPMKQGVLTNKEEENTFGVTRYPCMPSLVALQQMRNRLHLAFLGRKLMKWTALATGRELRRLAAELYEVYQGFGEDLRNAFILLARSRYFYPQLNYIVTEDVCKKAGVVVQQSAKTVSGVKIVQFEIFETEYPPYAHLGIEKGGQTILETKKAWLDLLKRLIMMMQLRASFLMVELANKNATKKSNVLAKIVIPRLNVTSYYILAELEEKEREEVFRLKRVKQKKDMEKKLDEDRRRQLVADEGKKLKPAPSRSKEEVPSRTRSKESGSLAVIKKEDN